MAASKGALIGRYESKGRNIPKFILNSVIGFVFAAVIVLFANFAVPMSIPVYVAITGVLTALIMVFLWRVVHKHPPAYEIYDGGGVLRWGDAKSPHAACATDRFLRRLALPLPQFLRARVPLLVWLRAGQPRPVR